MQARPRPFGTRIRPHYGLQPIRQSQLVLVPTESGLEAFEFVEVSPSPLKIIVELSESPLFAETGAKLEFCFFCNSDVWIFC